MLAHVQCSFSDPKSVADAEIVTDEEASCGVLSKNRQIDKISGIKVK